MSDHRAEIVAAFEAARADGTLAAAIAVQFDKPCAPEISVERLSSFQQAIWRAELAWPSQAPPNLPKVLALKAHPGRFSVWHFSDRDLGQAERAAYAVARGAGVTVPAAFDIAIGGHFVLALEWVEGARPETAQDFEAVGQALARLHSQAAAKQDLPSYSLQGFLAHLHETLIACDEPQAAHLAADLRQDMTDDLPPVLSHGDPHQGNWVIGANGLPCLLDFEDAAFFPAPRDLAVLARAVDQPSFAAVVTGYQSAGGVVPDDLGSWLVLLALQDFALAAHIKFAHRAGRMLPPMDIENWAHLSTLSVDQIAALRADWSLG